MQIVGEVKGREYRWGVVVVVVVVVVVESCRLPCALPSNNTAGGRTQLRASLLLLRTEMEMKQSNLVAELNIVVITQVYHGRQEA